MLLTTKDVMELLNISRATIYRYIENRELPVIRIGNNWRFRKEDIEAYIESKRI